VIELGILRDQTGLDVAQALPIGQLGEGHRAILLGAGQCLDVAVATVAIHVSRECGPRQEVHQLGEQSLAGVHAGLRDKARNPA